MKRLALIMAAALAFCFIGSAAIADTYVQGYYRKDGTYVQPHYRSSPNQYKFDNYSSKGNTNPYTGQKGTQRHEFTSPPDYSQSYWGQNR